MKPIRSRSFVPALLAAVLAATLSSISNAALINTTVITDTPTSWVGYVDWTSQVTTNTATLGTGPNWTVAVTEVSLGNGLGFLTVSARHAVSPHEPPTVNALFLGVGFLGAPGSAAGPSTDTELHEDAAGHFDSLMASLVSTTTGVSRLHIRLEHLEAAVPEPSALGLLGFGFVGLSALRRRSAKP